MIRAVLAAAALAAGLLGCAGQPPAAVEVKEAVFTPCKTDVPPRPAFPGDELAGDEDLFTMGTALWAERLVRKAYELQLEVRLQGCVKQPSVE